MDEILLIEAVERYLKGDMSPEEKAFFEGLRKSNPEVDQMVVEHTFFLHGLEKHADLKSFKHTLVEAEADMMSEGVIKEPLVTGKAKLVQLWSRYKRSMSVAASIALFISVLTAGLNTAYNNQSKEDQTISWLKQLSIPNVHIFNFDEPYNFARMNNVVVQKYIQNQEDIICFLNNDVELTDVLSIQKMTFLM